MGRFSAGMWQLALPDCPTIRFVAILWMQVIDYSGYAEERSAAAVAPVPGEKLLTGQAEHCYPAPSPLSCGSCPFHEPCRAWSGQADSAGIDSLFLPADNNRRAARGGSPSLSFLAMGPGGWPWSGRRKTIRVAAGPFPSPGILEKMLAMLGRLCFSSS